jgi:hypothetical protein
VIPGRTGSRVGYDQCFPTAGKLPRFREMTMSIVVDLHVAPAQGRALSQGQMVKIVEQLLDQDLVVPPYRLLRGARLLTVAASHPSTLGAVDFPWRGKLPKGARSLYEKDDPAALLAALKDCDLGKQTIAVSFGGLNWKPEKCDQGFYYPGESLILFTSPDKEMTFEQPDQPRESFDEHLRISELTKKRVRSVKAARFRQCLILHGEKVLAGLLCDELKGSELQRFVEKHFGSPLQVCESYC